VVEAISDLLGNLQHVWEIVGNLCHAVRGGQIPFQKYMYLKTLAKKMEIFGYRKKILGQSSLIAANHLKQPQIR